MVDANLWVVVSSALGLVVLGLLLGLFVRGLIRRHHESELEKEAEERILRRLAEEERHQRLSFLEEKDKWYKAKAGQEKRLEKDGAALNQREKSLKGTDRELSSGQEELRKEWSRLKGQEQQLESRDRATREEEKKLQKSRSIYEEKLELAANMTSDEAREQLLEHVAGDIRARSAAMIRAERTRAKEESEREARKIISLAVQRCAVEEAVRGLRVGVLRPRITCVLKVDW